MNEFVQTIVKYKVGNLEFNTNAEAEAYLNQMKEKLNMNFYKVITNPVYHGTFVEYEKSFVFAIPKGAIANEKAFLQGVLLKAEGEPVIVTHGQIIPNYLMSEKLEFGKISDLQEFLEENEEKNPEFFILEIS